MESMSLADIMQPSSDGARRKCNESKPTDSQTRSDVRGLGILEETLSRQLLTRSCRWILF